MHLAHLLTLSGLLASIKPWVGRCRWCASQPALPHLHGPGLVATVSESTPLLCAAGASACASAALAPSAQDPRTTLESSMGLKRSPKIIPAESHPSRGCSPVGWPSCVRQLPITELMSAGLQGIPCCLLVRTQSLSKAVSPLSTCKTSCTACCRLLTLVQEPTKRLLLHHPCCCLDQTSAADGSGGQQAANMLCCLQLT